MGWFRRLRDGRIIAECPSCGAEMLGHIIRHRDKWEACATVIKCQWRTCMDCELTLDTAKPTNRAIPVGRFYYNA